MVKVGDINQPLMQRDDVSASHSTNIDRMEEIAPLSVPPFGLSLLALK